VLRNLTVHGAVPLVATETYDLSLFNCDLVYDTVVDPANLVAGMIVNTVRRFTMQNGSVQPSASQYASLELPQRNSEDVTFDTVLFKARSVAFGEYAAHWKLTNNTLWLYPDNATNVGIAVGGLDVQVTGNVVHGGNVTAGGGSGALLSDHAGPDSYLAYIGKIQFRSNTVDCRADGNSCMRLTTADPVVSNNRITATGTACGVKVEGLGDNFVLTNNVIAVGAAPAIILNVQSLDNALLSGNQLSGTGPQAVYVEGPLSSTVVNHFLSGNSISGFRKPAFLNPNPRSPRGR
jgi:hypothetical protein